MTTAGDVVVFLCAGDMAGLRDPEFCVACERHGERDDMAMTTDELGDRTVANWWHIACLDEHERWHEQRYGDGPQQ